MTVVENLHTDKTRSTTKTRLEEQKQVVIEEWKNLGSNHRFKVTADNSIQGIPTIGGLLKAVMSAETSWQDKSLTGFHKLRDRFCSFAGAMGNYSYLFQIIPSGDKYFSLVTGVVSSMVKVSNI